MLGAGYESLSGAHVRGSAAVWPCDPGPINVPVLKAAANTTATLPHGRRQGSTRRLPWRRRDFVE